MDNTITAENVPFRVNVWSPRELDTYFVRAQTPDQALDHVEKMEAKSGRLATVTGMQVRLDEEWIELG